MSVSFSPLGTDVGSWFSPDPSPPADVSEQLIDAVKKGHLLRVQNLLNAYPISRTTLRQALHATPDLNTEVKQALEALYNKK